MIRQQILDNLEHYDELTILELFNISSVELVKFLDDAGWIDTHWDMLEHEFDDNESRTDEQ